MRVLVSEDFVYRPDARDRAGPQMLQAHVPRASETRNVEVAIGEPHEGKRDVRLPGQGEDRNRVPGYVGIRLRPQLAAPAISA